MAASSRLIGNTIEILSPNAGSDWSLGSLSSQPDLSALEPGIPINYMLYTPGASRDIVVVKDRNDTGTLIAKFECGSSTDQKIVYMEGARKKPYVDVSAGTHGRKTVSILQIVME